MWVYNLRCNPTHRWNQLIPREGLEQFHAATSIMQNLRLPCTAVCLRTVSRFNTRVESVALLSIKQEWYILPQPEAYEVGGREAAAPNAESFESRKCLSNYTKIWAIIAKISEKTKEFDWTRESGDFCWNHSPSPSPLPCKFFGPHSLAVTLTLSHHT